MIRALTAKESSYLSDPSEFTNFAYSFTLVESKENERIEDLKTRAASALALVAADNALLTASICVANNSLVFRQNLDATIPLRVDEEGESLDVVVECGALNNMSLLYCVTLSISKQLIQQLIQQLELATPLHVFKHGLSRVVLVPNQSNKTKVGIVFTFAHAAFDGAVAAHIVFQFVRALKGIKEAEKKPAIEDFAQDMVPKTERTWSKFVRFILNLLGLYYFIYTAKPSLLRKAPQLSPDESQILFESLKNTKGMHESALNAQLTRIVTRHFTAQETAAIIQRAKSLKVSVTSLLGGAMGAAFASDQLLPPTPPASSKKSPVRQISLLTGLAVNGRPARSIPTAVNGAFNYVLLLPHVSINITSTPQDLIRETDIQSLLISHELKARLHRNEPYQLARFLPSQQLVAFKWSQQKSQDQGVTPKMYQLAPEKAKDSLPVGYTLSNVGNFLFSGGLGSGDTTTATPNNNEVVLDDFRFVSTMRCDINTRRIELSVVTLDGKMTVAFSHLNGMVGHQDIDVLFDRFLTGLMG
ncbi:UNVERIFIED_CONTAM: hypothetical protein HDU68_010723 [Siphonaria sp. JEL0065]|nr:hypothetical protein HDU68_010723 [Siphonaria sp. JEL0065]